MFFDRSQQNEVFVVDDLSYTIPAKSGSSVAYIFVFDQSELEMSSDGNVVWPIVTKWGILEENLSYSISAK